MCDMCSSPEATYKIEVEGSILRVCEKCSSFGRIVGQIKQEVPEKKKKKQEKKEKAAVLEAEAKARKGTETMQVITANYASIIKSAREKMGLKQEDVAKKLAEKESIIHKLESGIIQPDITLARKLEKFLKISIVEEIEVDDSVADNEKRKSSDSLTIGDLLKI